MKAEAPPLRVDPPDPEPASDKLDLKRLPLTTIGALGVVFGDLATSPLYCTLECFNGSHRVDPTQANVMGVISLILWALVLIVSLQYAVFVMRADHHGEGGILALMVLALSKLPPAARSTFPILLMGMFGAALLFGDGTITPAISVLSAVEGLNVATSAFRRYVMPATVVILFGLFLLQRYGTRRIGWLFGPIMLAWFIGLAVMGVRGIAQQPGVLGAVNPYWALRYVVDNGLPGLPVLGGVILAVTGAEALYADMGHFGKTPIRIGWFAIALPCLFLNYLGQGAVILTNPRAAEYPFYWMVPAPLLYPTVLLATAATVIASQAIISGVFSLARQAVQLDCWPRMRIVYTSEEEIGQVYAPLANWTLMSATIALVLVFQTANNLAAAFGVAISTTVVVTTLLLNVVARRVWGWHRAWAALLTGLLLVVNLTFAGATYLKVTHGGWLPLVMAGVLFVVMTTWRRGRQILNDRLRIKDVPLEDFIEEMGKMRPMRAPGTAVYLSSTSDGTPPALLYNLRFNNAVHEHVVVLIIHVETDPRVPKDRRVEIERLHGVVRVHAHYGYLQSPCIEDVLRACNEAGLDLDLNRVTFVLSGERLLATPKPGMMMWRERLFSLLARNARSAASFFEIPPQRVVELTAEVEL